MARKNGWQTPFHLLQVLTWVVFPSIMVLFFVFYTPLLNVTAAYLGSLVRLKMLAYLLNGCLCAALETDMFSAPSPSSSLQAYGASCIFTVYSVVVCTKTDPSDDCILRPSSVRSF